MPRLCFALLLPLCLPITSAVPSFGDTAYGFWLPDTFGNPSFRFLGGPSPHPAALFPTSPAILHAAGNDRLSALIFSDGTASLRQDEGGPKLLHGISFSPPSFQFRGGAGYLSANGAALAASIVDGTVGLPPASPLSLTLGMGYAIKAVPAPRLSPGAALQHTLLAPWGDASVLLSLAELQGAASSGAAEWTEVWAAGARFEMGWGGDHCGGDAAAFQVAWQHAFELLRDPATGSPVGLVEVASHAGASGDPTQPSKHDPAPRPSFYVCLTCFASNGGSGLRSYTTRGGAVYCPGGTASCSGAGPLSPLAAGSPLPGGLDNETSSFGASAIAALQAPFPNAASASGGAATRTAAFLVGYLTPEDEAASADGCSAVSGALAACVLQKLAPFVATWEQEAARTASAWRVGANSMEFGSGAARRAASLAARAAAAQDPAAAVPAARPEGASWVSWEGREAAWQSYMLRSALHRDSFFNVHYINQAGNYLFIEGMSAAIRDPLAHAMGLTWAGRSAHGYVVDALSYALQQKRAATDALGRPRGSFQWGTAGHGWGGSMSFNASDLELQLFFALSQHVLATRSASPVLSLPVPVRPGSAPGGENISDAAWASFFHLRDVTGTGAHGLIRLLYSDHNDGLLGGLGVPLSPDVMQHAESVMDGALAAYVLPLLAEALALGGAPVERRAAVAALGAAQRAAVAAAWAANASTGAGWYKRTWLGAAGWRGAADTDGTLWTETQSWALLGGVPQATPGRAEALVREVQAMARDPSPIGAINSAPDTTVDGGVAYGGVWMCGSVALISALGLRGWPDLALDEWRKASCAGHAAAYPYIWFGATAGSDVWSSMYGAHHNVTPGSTRCHWNDPGSSSPCHEAAFPVLNSWTATLGTYPLPSLMGAEWDSAGLLVRPMLAQAEYTIFTPLVSVSHWGGGGGTNGSCGFAGHWAPVLPAGAAVRLRIGLLPGDAAACKGIEVNGEAAPLVWAGGEVIVEAALREVEGVPLLAWELF